MDTAPTRLPKRRTFFVEIVGINGLCETDDDFLEQFRLLVLQIERRRPVGESVKEFRTLLLEQHTRLADHSIRDNMLYILYCEQTGVHGEIKVCGLITLQVSWRIGHPYVIMDDLIVAGDYRDMNYTTQLINKCLEHAKRLGIENTYYNVPPRHAGWLKSKLESRGFTHLEDSLFQLRLS